MTGIAGLFHQAGRALARRPMYAVLAASTVAAGIAASTASFVLVDAALLSPLPFRDPGRLVTPSVLSTKGFEISLSVPNYRDWSERNRVLESSGAAAGWSTVVSGRGPARSVNSRQVLGDFFRTLGLVPAYGRLFTAAESDRGAAPIAVLGWGFFNELGGDPALVGSSLTLEGVEHTIVGILPAGTGYPSAETALYLPLGALGEDLPWTDRDSSFGMRMIGRLRPDATLATARKDFDRVATEVRELEGRDVATPRVQPLADLFVGSLRAPFLLLFAIAALVVILAVANVTNLLLARAEGRRAELAVRAALGAPRWDAARLLLGESAWIAFLGATFGVAGATALVVMLRGWIAGELPLFVAERLSLGWRAGLFAVGLATVVAIALTLLASWRVQAGRAAASGLHGTRAVSSRGADRLRQGLVVGQLALGTLLAAGALMLASSVERLRSVDKGFDASGVVTARLTPPDGHFGDVQSWRAFHRELATRAAALPGVRSASVSLMLPLTNRSWELALTPEDVPYDPHGGDSVLFNIVSSDHFATLGVPLLRGRLFDERDRDEGELVTIVDASLAERYWPGENPLGRRVTFEVDGDDHAAGAAPVYRTIVGVVANVRHYELENPSRIQVYVPLEQTRGRGGFGLYLAARGDSATSQLIAALPRLVAEVDPEIPTRDVATMAARIDAATVEPRLLARTATAIGVAALLLAAVGTFAVASYGVAARRRELGLRQALGASPAVLLRGVLLRGLSWAAVGSAIGIAGAIGGARLASALLWGVGALEAAPYLAAAATLGSLAVAACALPAFQAMRIDPAAILRDET